MKLRGASRGTITLSINETDFSDKEKELVYKRLTIFATFDSIVSHLKISICHAGIYLFR